MISKWRLFVAAVAGLLFCFAVGAQTHGAAPGRMGSVRMSSSARAVTMQPRTTNTARQGLPTVRQSRVTFVSPSGRVTSGFAPTGDFAGFESEDVPGLGFDFPHLAAISGALQNGSFRFGHHEHNGGGPFVPIWFGGYPFYYDDSSYEQAPQQAEPQPQIIVIQQPAPAQPVADSAGEAENAAVAPSPQTSETVRDVGEFILVRRDGRIVFASMFSVVGEQLLYITPEGLRHTIPVAELDADATQQMNEAPGTIVQLHN